jgi:hypothetical protein
MDERNHTRPSYDGFLTKALDPLAFKANAEQGVLSGYASQVLGRRFLRRIHRPARSRRASPSAVPIPTPRILLRYEHEYTIGTHKMVEDASGPRHRGEGQRRRHVRHRASGASWPTACRTD